LNFIAESNEQIPTYETEMDVDVSTSTSTSTLGEDCPLGSGPLDTANTAPSPLPSPLPLPSASLLSTRDHDEEQQQEEEEEEEGVYSSYIIGEAPMRVKVLLLDTRYHRDSHWLRSLGEMKWLPLSALVAAALRVVTTFLDIGSCREHAGDMLGERQWAWLEQQLGPSSSLEGGVDFHVIVSSVQVFTTNPGQTTLYAVYFDDCLCPSSVYQHIDI
jgi:hypothetical protein